MDYQGLESEVRKWVSTKDKELSVGSEPCEHWLMQCASAKRMPTVRDYASWKSRQWREAQWLPGLIDRYKIILCGVHYYSRAFRRSVVAVPIYPEKVEAEMVQANNVLYEPSVYQQHLAVLARDSGQTFHFRFGNTGKQSGVVVVSKPALEELYDCFEVCHLDVTLDRLNKTVTRGGKTSGLWALGTSMLATCFGLKEEDIKAANVERINATLRAFVISFYSTLTAVKKLGVDFLVSEAQPIVDAFFLPVKITGQPNRVVVPSLHVGVIDGDMLVELMDLYSRIHEAFVLWESGICEVPSVQELLKSVDPSGRIEDAKKKLEVAKKNLRDRKQAAALSDLENAIALLDSYLKGLPG